MEVNVKKAIKVFFSKSSFEMIYFEAFANALDAGATEFHIHISIPEWGDWKNMTLELSDNGVGFTDERFEKFKRLLDVEETSHKGLGRLVYLCYFDLVRIESVFAPGVARKFDFTDIFDGNCVIEESGIQTTGAYLKLIGFSGEKIGKIDYINTHYIKNVLLENFYMKLYKIKMRKGRVVVNITTTISGQDDCCVLDSDSIPEFRKLELSNQLDLFQSIELFYSIRQLERKDERRVITALAVDDRSHQVSIIADENMPPGYEMVFLLMSDTFKGSINESRQNLTIPEATLNEVKAIFRGGIAMVINQAFPEIAEINLLRRRGLEKTFPHLSGYFDNNEIGYSSQSDVLKKAQDKYFRDQKDILGATDLTPEQFEKSMTLSARALAEYIIFRQNVIKKMRSFDKKNLEADIHNLLAPKGFEFKEGELTKDLYSNNVWVLDEKFMSYCTILSEAEMTKVIDVLTEGEVKETDDDRPDIVLFFSGDPTKEGNKVDVVVVELKRLGLRLEQNSIVDVQLQTRTIRLAHYFNKRIQRMWFYGIVEFDEDFEGYLINQGYNPLFSTGSVYFRSKEIFTDKTKSYGVIQNAYMMDYKALVEDASSRNETFLKILQSNFGKV